ncbi:helix-turn-helix domain-containing protein [Phenylobacterium sp.]|jgi:excisionase family DNA binding protein|uniref:helix-turn-helix domain-containing protein n=1 Tax=Phenylobacterium sp. TaxID=1871053 RepID=UPI002F9554D2
MPLEMAARYVSLDEASFLSLCRVNAVAAVEPAKGAYRWRRRDIDRLVNELPPSEPPTWQVPSAATAGGALSDADVARIAARVGAAGPQTPQAYSVKDAAAVSGIGRSTLYKLMKDGRLTVVRVGSRTLIPRQAIEALLSS